MYCNNNHYIDPNLDFLLLLCKISQHRPEADGSDCTELGC